MNEDSNGKQIVVYSEMTEADQKLTFEVAVNAMKLQEKGNMKGKSFMYESLVLARV